ncbi:amidohydrolase family protein [Microbacterium sp. M3]|uniref:Amidohydrolase family protein n=1 Tax=Microbacterium arthrosphaerae TaxID=792652 RepID=A0ABU4H679_9MICO|nr:MULTISPECIES: amidohydrolase family protein [Microbacterium]MDW4574222.1 amidohydrolase family protein [Microbacterium arthrosphaerae]MDW7608077.1 amidohydrolase family protein [Microbacterium sp. M3]
MSLAVVDAHVHLWDVDAVPLSWWRPDLGLPRAALLDDLLAVTRMAPSRVARAIAVQAADTAEEAEWLAGTAAASPFLGAVVLQYDARTDAAAWAGMAQPVIDRTEAGDIRAEAGHIRARVGGIRLATPTGAPDFGDVPGLESLARGLGASGRVLELLIRSEQLPAAADLAARHPALAVVVCHLALNGEAPDAEWRAVLAAFARQPNARAKVSGLVRGGNGDDARVRTALAHAFEVLGPERLMFGSDWPVSARFAGYGEVLERTAAALPALGADESQAFWAGTANGCYAVAPSD